MTKFPVIWLWIVCILFVGFGVGFIVMPAELAELLTGAAPRKASAIIDMRATYGGVALGVGLFIGMCARRPEWLPAGLVAALLTSACLGAARLLGIIVDGSPNAFMVVFLLTEVASVALSAIARRQVRAVAG
jgi:hypothetical protein